MKAQVIPINAVIATGIGVALMAAAYFWGIPMIEKQTTLTGFLTAETFVFSLDNKIIGLANTGGGGETINVPGGSVWVVSHDDADPYNNSIIVEMITKYPIISPEGTQDFVPLRTSNLEEPAPYGAEPRMIKLESEGHEGVYKLRFVLHYRELYTETRGYKIALKKGTITGNSYITISFEGSETIPDGAKRGGDLVLTYIRVDAV